MLSVENVTYAIAHTQYGEGVEQDLVQTNDLNVATLGKEEMVAQAEDFLKRIGITDAEVVETAASEWLCYDWFWGRMNRRPFMMAIISPLQIRLMVILHI